MKKTQGLAGSILADQITDELRHREAEEFNRVLYVALTRAKKGVSLLWDHKVGKNPGRLAVLSNLEEGFHQEKDFSYVVRKENMQPLKMREQDLAQKEVRNSWQALAGQEKRKYISVTELVAPESLQKTRSLRRRLR